MVLFQPERPFGVVGDVHLGVLNGLAYRNPLQSTCWVLGLLQVVVLTCPASGLADLGPVSLLASAAGANDAGAFLHTDISDKELSQAGACARRPHSCARDSAASSRRDPLENSGDRNAIGGSSNARFSAIASSSSSTSSGAATADSFTHDDAASHSAAADAVGGAVGGAVDDRDDGRHLLATFYPSSITNGSASASFPAAAFASWCAADATCSAAGELTLSLPFYTDASPFTSVTLNWPSVFSGANVSSLQLVSGVVELQFANYPAKLDQLICSASTANCTAQLSIPLNSSADLTQSFVCLRLEPSVTGNSYQAYGYPPGSDGTSLNTTVVSGAMRCDTNRFGKHVIMQYSQTALLPPSPPSPPLPPPLNAVGVKYTYDVQLQMTVPLSIAFDTLNANASLLSNLTSSLESSLAAGLATASSQLLLDASGSSITSTLHKISRAANSSTTAVTAQFQLVVAAGATEGQVQALINLLSYNTTYMFAGSPYTSFFTSYANVSYMSSSSTDGISTRGVIAIAVCSFIATMLLVGAVYGLYRWRAYVAILPKKPEGPWDATGVAVMPRKAARRRKLQQNKLEPAAADAHGGQLPPTPPSPPPPAVSSSMGGGPTAEGRLRPEPLWAGGGGAPWLKSKPELSSPTRQAWG